MAVQDSLVAVLPFYISAVPKSKPEDNLEFADRLGYTFKDRSLLRHALTHASSLKIQETYERLEFLGDRVLGLIVAELMYRQHGTEQEGRLSARHSAIVRGDKCADVAQMLGVGDMMQIGPTECKQGVHLTRSILGDVMEALIGAVYLDGGIEEARSFVLRHWDSVLNNPDNTLKDAKTFVQEWILARSKALPIYELVSRTGPEHKLVFVVKLTVDRFGEAEGQGRSKQTAEMAAAQNFITSKGLR